jgi:rare lipoprotein A
MLLSFYSFSQDAPEVLASNQKSNKSRVISEAITESEAGGSGNTITTTGYATYYARKFEGRKTTSGVRYRGSKMTAAHLKLPFGTIVTVTNLSNGKSVELEVNDRGPHSKKFIIDVSEGAAKELGFFGKGISQVEISYRLPDES